MERFMQREHARLGGLPTPPAVRRRASARAGGSRLLDGRVVAVVLGVLAALGLIGATLTFVVDLFVAPWRIYTLDLEESLHLLASVICLAGAFRLSRGAHQAKHVVLAGLGLNIAATLAFSSSTLPRPETVVPLLTWLGLGGVTVAARVTYP
jgi:peptidoglycan/LPS O-acetylase OafA/YrhL